MLLTLYTNCSAKEHISNKLNEKIVNKVAISSYIDKETNIWTSKREVFVGKLGECKLSYSVSQSKDKKFKTSLFLRNKCHKPFIEQIPVHKALLEKIFTKYPKEKWATFAWGHFATKDNFSWTLPIARASIKSKEYRDYLLHYPNTPYNINKIFVKLANETLAYKELQRIFNELRHDIKLTSVEKVFTTKAKNYELYSVLKKEGINPEQRLIYNVGMSYFRIQ